MPRWISWLVRVLSPQQKEKPVTFPVTVIVSCDPNPPADGVTSYTFTMDGGGAKTSPTPSVSMSVPAAGTHVFTVVATNVWGDSDPLTASVNINPAGKPTNIKIVKG